MREKTPRPYRLTYGGDRITVNLDSELIDGEATHFQIQTDSLEPIIILYEGVERRETELIPLGENTYFSIPDIALNIEIRTYNGTNILNNQRIRIGENKIYCVYYVKSFSDYSLLTEFLSLKNHPGVRGIFRRKSLPGIIFLIGNLTGDEEKKIIKNIRPFLRFSKNPIHFEEFRMFFEKKGNVEKFKVGDKIEIQEDPLRGEVGTILEIDMVKNLLYVTLSFGLKTKISIEAVKIVK